MSDNDQIQNNAFFLAIVDDDSANKFSNQTNNIGLNDATLPNQDEQEMQNIETDVVETTHEYVKVASVAGTYYANILPTIVNNENIFYCDDDNVNNANNFSENSSCIVDTIINTSTDSYVQISSHSEATTNNDDDETQSSDYVSTDLQSFIDAVNADFDQKRNEFNNFEPQGTSNYDTGTTGTSSRTSAPDDLATVSSHSVESPILDVSSAVARTSTPKNVATMSSHSIESPTLKVSSVVASFSNCRKAKRYNRGSAKYDIAMNDSSDTTKKRSADTIDEPPQKVLRPNYLDHSLEL